jgi:hypothetical protein
MKTIIIAAILLVTSYAQAIPVLDQIYFDPVLNSTGGTSRPDNSFRRAQTFTVGIGGLLNSVDVFDGGGLGSILNFWQMSGTPGSMRILATSNGVPTFTVLASMNVALYTTDNWVTWDFSSSGLFVTPGEVLALDLLIPMQGPGWSGHVPGGYSGGADYFLNTEFGILNFTRNTNLDVDWFFRTFVGEGERSGLQPLPPPPPPPRSIPEPSALWLLLAGSLVLLWTKFSRRPAKKLKSEWTNFARL